MSSQEMQIYEIFTFLEDNLQHLPFDEQYSLLRSLLSSTNGYVKWRVKSYLALEESPDLMTLLPNEIQRKILLMVDGCSLLSACQVSQKWKLMMNIHGLIWKKTCKDLGVYLLERPSCLSWKSMFISARRQLELLQTGRAFVGKPMNLQNSRSIIKAMGYQKGGHLCTVSDDDFVIIWNLTLNIPLFSFPVEHKVSCVKFKGRSQLVCGHYTGILTSWDITDVWKNNTMAATTTRTAYFNYEEDYGGFSMMLAIYRMHSAVVFCCDFSEELQILVSGGADGIVKFWCLRSATLLHNFSKKSWILRLILNPHDSSCSGPSVLCLTAENAYKLTWVHEYSQQSDKMQSQEEDKVSISNFEVAAEIELNNGSHNIAPGVQKSSKYLAFVKQDFANGTGELMLLDITTFASFHSITINYKVRKLLALGDRFALLLTAGEQPYTSSLVCVDIVTGKCIGTYNIPHSKMTTPDGAQIVVCETKWLNGLTGWKSNCSPANSCCQHQEIDVNDRLNCVMSKGKLLSHPYGSCVLAAGVQDEPQRIFTLWWTAGEDDSKSKVD